MPILKEIFKFNATTAADSVQTFNLLLNEILCNRSEFHSYTSK